MDKYSELFWCYSKTFIRKLLKLLRLQFFVFYIRRVFFKTIYNYSRWVNKFDTTTLKDLNLLGMEIQNFVIRPKISIIMVVKDPSPKFLNQAIQSVIRQLYSDWELCIASVGSMDPFSTNLLERYQKDEHKIKITYCDQTCNRSEASNIAIDLSTGDYIGFLEQSDLLAPHALFWFAYSINKFRNSEILYSDEDKIDKRGSQRSAPHFKPDFNYEMLLSFNFISNLCVYKRSLVRTVRGFNTEYENAQNYDLILRAIEVIDHSAIVHIPKILYHSRVQKKNHTKRSLSESNLQSDSVRAVAAHLRRCQIEADVAADSDFPHIHRLHFKLPKDLPLISIIIPTRDKAMLLECCLDSILKKTTYKNYEIIIIDNGSVEDATFQVFDKFKVKFKNALKIIPDTQPYNFSKLNNHAARYAQGEYLCFLNNDTEVMTNDWLEEMLSHASRTNIGCVGARLWYPNQRLQHGGVILGVDYGCAGHAHTGLKSSSSGYCSRAIMLQSMSAVTAACLLIKKEIFDAVRGFEESLAVDLNDIDLCLKVRSAGYRNVWTPHAQLIHYECASRGYARNNPISANRFEKERGIFFQRWKHVLNHDPAYNSNLSLKSVHALFTYAWPPRKPPQYEDCTFW